MHACTEEQLTFKNKREEQQERDNMMRESETDKSNRTLKYDGYMPISEKTDKIIS